MLLYFEAGIRLFAVGDVDQSIYGFTGANPELLRGLIARGDVREIRLRVNYRSGAKIIRASLGALGEDRDYHGMDNRHEGELAFWKVKGGLEVQSSAIVHTVLPKLFEIYPPEEVAVLYRSARLGDNLARELDLKKLPYIRTDGNALVKRSSRLARFIEACAMWATGGWREASPLYAQLLNQALAICLGRRSSDREEQVVSHHLIGFLTSSIDSQETTHFWLQRLYRELIVPMQAIARNPHVEWETCLDMISRTNPAINKDVSLNIFSGRIEGLGRVNLSTFHSAKGREFDAVVLYGMNRDDMPNTKDRSSPARLKELRRLFYVGVTRPRKSLSFVYQEGSHSPWIAELYHRSQIS